MQSGAEPRSNGPDGRAALEVIMALYESQRQGNARVPLPFPDGRPMLEVMREEGRL